MEHTENGLQIQLDPEKKRYGLFEHQKEVLVSRKDGSRLPIYFDTYEITPEGDILFGILKPQGPLSLEEKKMCLMYPYKWGVIRKDKVLIIEPLWDYIRYSNESSCVLGKIFEKQNIRYGYQDVLTGKEITPVVFREAKDFYEGRAAVCYQGYYGYIDRAKMMTDPNNYLEYALYPRFLSASDFHFGVASVMEFQNNFFWPTRRLQIDPFGQVVEVLSQNISSLKRVHK